MMVNQRRDNSRFGNFSPHSLSPNFKNDSDNQTYKFTNLSRISNVSTLTSTKASGFHDKKFHIRKLPNIPKRASAFSVNKIWNYNADLNLNQTLFITN